MFRLLFIRFIRSRTAIAGLLVLLMAGVTAIYIGKQHISKLQAASEQTGRYQQEHLQRYVRFVPDDIGLLLYYVRFGLVNSPEPLNGIAIGQRDVNPSVQNVTIRNLENQQYDTDLVNPMNLLAGNLDLSFVIIYLFPLMIIAFTYNLLSEEKEEGTWKLVSVQHARPRRVLFTKLYVRMIAVYVTLGVLLAWATVALAIPVNNRLLAVVALAVLYLLFWFALSLWFVSWQKNSGFNAVSLLSVWVMMTIICPAAVNNYMTAAYPVPEALATLVEQREGYHEKWDMDKKVTMDSFYAHYPQFAHYRLPEAEFSWLWYYAMQQMGDDEARNSSEAMKAQLLRRDETSRLFAWFVPTLHMQLQMNRLARADLHDHLTFLDSTSRFHEKMRLHFYPKIFDNAPVRGQPWRQYQLEYFCTPVPVNWTRLLLPVGLLTLLCSLAAAARLRVIAASE